MKLEPDETPAEEGDDDSAEAMSLEELSQTYVQLVTQSGSADHSGPTDAQEPSSPALSLVQANDETEATDEDSTNTSVSPRTILEAALFVGRPDNGGITAAEIAALMRGVDEQEIPGLVSELNAAYRQQHRALQIIESADGYRLGLTPETEGVKDRFYGKLRTIHLNQAAIDCLALVAYQPGISRQQLDEQRGQPSGGVLNQLVRRQLIEINRDVAEGKSITRYYPTDKLTRLAGLASLDDLPQVEEFE